ncbi:Auxin response factor 11 [Hordeum vulgare]|nr:Auxin response factor 11 [Hordeum vulgare]
MHQPHSQPENRAASRNPGTLQDDDRTRQGSGRGDHKEDAQPPHPELPEPAVPAVVPSSQHQHACKCTQFIFRPTRTPMSVCTDDSSTSELSQQQQLHAPKMQRGDSESCEVQPAIDSVSASELHVAGREPRNTDKYPSQSISEQNGKGEPRVKPRRSKKGSSRKTILENFEISSAPSRVSDDQQNVLEAKLVGCGTEQVKYGNNEGSSRALTHGDFAGQLQCQQVLLPADGC